MRTCGSAQIAEICRIISELEAMAGSSNSSSPSLLFSILYILSQDPERGRVQLARNLATSEQIIRSALKKLSDLGLLDISGRTKRLRGQLSSIFDCMLSRRIFHELELNDWMNPLLIGLQASNIKDLTVSDALLIRDEIIAWGGSAALIFYVKGRALEIPGIEEKEKFGKFLLREVKSRSGIYALVNTKYDYIDFHIFYGFVRKCCEILLREKEVY
ncbi:MAG: hypothetical protein QW039_04880 [Fervidicoccaceae archaeon]